MPSICPERTGAREHLQVQRHVVRSGQVGVDERINADRALQRLPGHVLLTGDRHDRDGHVGPHLIGVGHRRVLRRLNRLGDAGRPLRDDQRHAVVGQREVTNDVRGRATRTRHQCRLVDQVLRRDEAGEAAGGAGALGEPVGCTLDIRLAAVGRETLPGCVVAVLGAVHVPEERALEPVAGVVGALLTGDDTRCLALRGRLATFGRTLQPHVVFGILAELGELRLRSVERLRRAALVGVQRVVTRLRRLVERVAGRFLEEAALLGQACVEARLLRGDAGLLVRDKSRECCHDDSPFRVFVGVRAGASGSSGFPVALIWRGGGLAAQRTPPRMRWGGSGG